jgi:ELWxxDGT repeat protein
VNGTLYFAALAPMVGAELWKSNGTAAGTVMVKDIRTGNGESSTPAQLVAVGSTLFFQADDGTNGRELWKSDGTGPGTTMVADINPGGDAFVNNEFPGIVVNANGTLFFVADDGTTGDELWKSDGTGPGTVLV